MKILQRPILVLLFASLLGCSELAYYIQSAQGHFGILNKAQSIEELVADPDIDPTLREKLHLVLEARQFAQQTLKLPVSSNYSEYVELNRNYAVRNLVAAEEFSTQLYSWCYLIIGCANYKGYFDEQMLYQEYDKFEAQGYDTYVYEVTAYSTLGWFDDPILSSFIDLPPYRLAGLLFHELAHQQVFIADDTVFNESFAMAVEQAGLAAFYAAEDDAEQLNGYRAYQNRQGMLADLVIEVREDLEAIYQQSIADKDKRNQKQAKLQEFKQRYIAEARNSESARMDREIAEPGTPGSEQPSAAKFDPGEFNNARLGLIGAYHKLVPAFLALLDAHGQNFQLFYAHVEKLGGLNEEDRSRCLLLWSAVLEAGDQPGKPAKIPAMCKT